MLKDCIISFFLENKESRDVQHQTIYQLESDKFRLQEELQSTKDELERTREANKRLTADNERLSHVVDNPVMPNGDLDSTHKTKSNDGDTDSANTTANKSRNKTLNSKICVLGLINIILLKDSVHICKKTSISEITKMLFLSFTPMRKIAINNHYFT